jgi:alkaline phosphatase D
MKSFCCTLTILLLAYCSVSAHDGPYQATGFKVGEVTDTTAIVWTRLTKREHRNPTDAPNVNIEYLSADGKVDRRGRTVSAVVFENGVGVSDIRLAVPGVDGDVRILFKPRSGSDWKQTTWQEVNPLGDFTRQFTLSELQPGTRYDVKIESRTPQHRPGQTLNGEFQTAPARESGARVVFTVSTCHGDDDQDRPDGFNIFPEMLKLDPNFYVHAGDIVYYDGLAKTVDLARYHWQRAYSWPTNVEFHRRVSSYFIKDDHDTWRNDCWPSMDSPFMYEFTFRQGQAIFKEQVPMGERTWRTHRWGKDLQIWMVEGRDFRSPNTDPDGADKTIWGKEQKEWFRKSLLESDATFKILISPTPVVGPDRPTKKDNHSNAGFAHEGAEIRSMLGAQKNAFVICGDRHWQYASVDPKTKLHEYSVGAASDEHAGGWKPEDFIPEYHRYMKVIGGFMSVTVDRENNKPVITFRHHNVKGTVVFEDRIND